MISDHDCVPGLDRPVTLSEYATLQGLREADVLAEIRQLKIPAAYFRDQWFIEAPRNCQARLAQLRGEQPPPRKDKVNVPCKSKVNIPRKDKVGIPALEDEEFWARVEREAESYDTPTDVEQNVMLKGTEHIHGDEFRGQVTDHVYVRGLKEPLSASEYAKLEGPDEKAILDRIHALHGVYSLGWYLEAPPYSEERLARLRGEPKLEPRLLNWLQRRADLHDNPQYKSEVERLRAHFIKSDPWFDGLPPADQNALVTTNKCEQLPQP